MNKVSVNLYQNYCFTGKLYIENFVKAHGRDSLNRYFAVCGRIWWFWLVMRDYNFPICQQRQRQLWLSLLKTPSLVWRVAAALWLKQSSAQSEVDSHSVASMYVGNRAECVRAKHSAAPREPESHVGGIHTYNTPQHPAPAHQSLYLDKLAGAAVNIYPTVNSSSRELSWMSSGNNHTHTHTTPCAPQCAL